MSKEMKKTLEVAKYIRARMVNLVRISDLDAASFDKVFKDVFGVKKYSRMVTSRDAGKVIKAINVIGVKPLLSISNSKEEFLVFADMIQLCDNIDVLEAKIKKAEKKGTEPKEKWISDLKKLTKKYNKGVKRLREYYGVKSISGYSNLNRFLDSRGYDYWDDYSDDYDFGFGFGGFDFDDEDDFGFGVSPKKQNRRRGMMPITLDGDLDWDDLDDLTDEEDIDDEQDERISKLEDQLDKVVTLLERGVTPAPKSKRQVQVPTPIPTGNQDAYNVEILNALNTLGNTVGMISNRLKDIEDSIYDDELDDIDDDEYPVASPAEYAARQAEIMSQMMGEPNSTVAVAAIDEDGDGYAGVIKAPPSQHPIAVSDL